MKYQLLITAILTIAIPMNMMAQNNDIRSKQKKEFRIDDLIPGGKTYYRSSVPKREYTAWWGDQCVKLDYEDCSLVNKKNIQNDGETLFKLTDINRILAMENMKVQHFYYATFPYPDKPIVKLEANGKCALVDWEQKKVVWSQKRENDTQANEWNAQSRCFAYVKGDNLYVSDAEGNTKQLTTDGSPDIVYGQSVHRNEFGIEKGLFWNEDGTRLAFYRMDQSMVSAYPQVDIQFGHKGDDSRCAKLVPDKYPMAGETSHQVTIGIYDIRSGKTVWLDAGDPTDRYFTNIAWAPDGNLLYLIELDRSQKHAKLDAYNAETGKFETTLFTEDNDKYVEPLNPIQFLPWDANRFIYLSRKDGYKHIYLYKLKNKTAELERQLTAGQFEVIDLLGFNKSAKTIVYTSNEANPIGCALYTVDMKGKRMPLGDTSGWHSVELSESGQYATDSWAEPEGEIAHRQDIVNTKDGQRLTFVDSKDPWDDFKVPEMKVGTLKAADGVTDLYYRLILPTDFDPQKKYPAVVYVYGGPHAHNIDASRHWGARGWDIWMAQNGYVMFCLDNRGSEHRGRDFEQVTHRQLGVEEMKDQLKGVDFLKSLPYVDAERLGIHGWSFGGYMTTSLMTTYPDVFKVGVAGGPVIDWRFYEVMYGERYMETPQTNPEGYKTTSCIKKAGNLEGRLLIIYGGNDPVCVPQHTLSFLRACIDADSYPDLFTYPGDEHNMMGTDRVHLHNVITRYFNDHLK